MGGFFPIFVRADRRITCLISARSLGTFDEHRGTLGGLWRNAPWLVSNARDLSGDLLFRGAPRRLDAHVPPVRGILLRVDGNRWA